MLGERHGVMGRRPVWMRIRKLETRVLIELLEVLLILRVAGINVMMMVMVKMEIRFRGWWREIERWRRGRGVMVNVESCKSGGNKGAQREKQAGFGISVLLNGDDILRVDLNGNFGSAGFFGGGEAANGHADQRIEKSLHFLYLRIRTSMKIPILLSNLV